MNQPVRRQGDMVHVAPDAMQRLVTEIFACAGCSRTEAERVATRLTGANLRGHDSHGIIRTPRYVQWIEDGRVVPDQSVRIESDTDTIAIVDGRYGFGQTVGEQTVDIGIEKAKRHGVAVTALRNAGHLGRIGDWAERAAAAGVASIHMVNVRGSLIVAPFGGVDRRGSTSPFCCGIPLAGEEPVILDFATSLVAEGKALVALRGGKPLPDGALVTPDGQLTSDPSPLYGEVAPGRYPDPNNGPGALTCFGMHKGSGLNFFMEMFAGALTGSGTSAGASDTERRRFCNGMLSIYMALEFFHSDDWFAREVKDYIAFWKSARPTEPGGEVLVPGEKERRTMAARRRDGLPLAPMTWDDIVATARRVGMDEAAIEQALGGRP
ncbi:MAG: Ldh family oxidoreductase [Ectothiorhodospiraceae bacterium]|nr:Ldh family oxidoreductase [Ectothiorhodospiraceae bacterium]